MLQIKGLDITAVSWKGSTAADAENDLETREAIVEITQVTGGKGGQLLNVLNNDQGRNPLHKTVILYAPNYAKQATEALDGRVLVVKSRSALINLLYFLKVTGKNIHGN